MFYTVIGGIILFALIKDLIIDETKALKNDDLPYYDDEEWDNEDTK